MSISALTFNGVTLSPISHKNQIWLTSVELAKALGYAHENAIAKIYNRNKDEFTETMSTLLPSTQIGSHGVSSGVQRAFSLRGCHLIAMFSRTAIAKLFRVWVLDILDKEVSQQKPYALRESFTCPFANQHQSKPIVALSTEFVTPAQIEKVEAIIAEIKQHVHFEASASWNVYASIRELYKVESFAKLPAKHFDEVMASLNEKLELAKKHHHLLCEADKGFIKNVLKKSSLKLNAPIQYGLLA